MPNASDRQPASRAVLAVGLAVALFCAGCSDSGPQGFAPAARTVVEPTLPTLTAAAEPLAAQPLAAARPTAVVPRSAEARLLHIIQLIEQQQLDPALRAAALLTEEVPNFRAAQLVYADLLRYKTGRRAGPGTSPSAHVAAFLVDPANSTVAATDATSSSWEDQLQGLRKELQRRVHGVESLPERGHIPAQFQQLDPSVGHAMAIDASKSRLYLFAHENGQLRLTGDFYVSIGKLGMGKSQEGDQRTPQGMYFIGREIAGVKLPEFYGKGALTLNYPNDWDKVLERSGDGIWLHGSPPDQFARLPEASDGCIVLSNADLILLMKTVGRQTPVLIRDSLQWVHPAVQLQAQATFTPVLGAWQQAWKNADPQVLGRIYQPDALPGPATRARFTEFSRFADASLQNVSVYAWSDAGGEIRIVDAHLRSASAGKYLPLRQYWRKVGAGWRIFSEELKA